MEKIYSSDDAVLVGYLYAALTNKGIACMQRNAFLAGAVGEIPPNECWVSLWVVNPCESQQARVLVEALLKEDENQAADWICSNCQETRTRDLRRDRPAF